MKSVVIAAVLAAVMVAGAMLYMNRLDYVSKSLIGMNEMISEDIEREDFDSASAGINGIKSYIEKKRTLLDAMGDHNVLDQIEMNLFELESYTNSRQKTDALSKCRLLDFLFGHMPKNEYVKLENIL